MADGCGSVVVGWVTVNGGLGCSCAGFNGSWWFLRPFQGSLLLGGGTGLRVGAGDVAGFLLRIPEG